MWFFLFGLSMSSELGFADRHRLRVLLYARVCSPVNGRDARGLFLSSFSWAATVHHLPGARATSAATSCRQRTRQPGPQHFCSFHGAGAPMAGEPTMCHALCLHCFLLFQLTAPRGTHCLTDEDKGSERGDRQEGHPCWRSGDYKTHARRCRSSLWSERQEMRI